MFTSNLFKIQSILLQNEKREKVQDKVELFHLCYRECPIKYTTAEQKFNILLNAYRFSLQWKICYIPSISTSPSCHIKTYPQIFNLLLTLCSQSLSNAYGHKSSNIKDKKSWRCRAFLVANKTLFCRASIYHSLSRIFLMQVPEIEQSTLLNIISKDRNVRKEKIFIDETVASFPLHLYFLWYNMPK